MPPFSIAGASLITVILGEGKEIASFYEVKHHLGASGGEKEQGIEW